MNTIRIYGSLASNSACMRPSSLSRARPRGVSLKPSRRNYQNILISSKPSTYLLSSTVSSHPRSSNSAPTLPTLPPPSQALVNSQHTGSRIERVGLVEQTIFRIRQHRRRTVDLVIMVLLCVLGYEKSEAPPALSFRRWGISAGRKPRERATEYSKLSYAEDGVDPGSGHFELSVRGGWGCLAILGLSLWNSRIRNIRDASSGRTFGARGCWAKAETIIEAQKREIELNKTRWDIENFGPHFSVKEICVYGCRNGLG